MRAAHLIPNDRTITKAQWKALDSTFRRLTKVAEVQAEKQFRDLVLYGTSYTRVDAIAEEVLNG